MYMATLFKAYKAAASDILRYYALELEWLGGMHLYLAKNQDEVKTLLQKYRQINQEIKI